MAQQIVPQQPYSNQRSKEVYAWYKDKDPEAFAGAVKALGVQDETFLPEYYGAFASPSDAAGFNNFLRAYENPAAFSRAAGNYFSDNPEATQLPLQGQTIGEVSAYDRYSDLLSAEKNREPEFQAAADARQSEFGASRVQQLLARQRQGFQSTLLGRRLLDEDRPKRNLLGV